MHPVLALFRRNAWASRKLLEFCAAQPPDVVRRVDADVYGSIEASFNHIVAAEARYLSRLCEFDQRGNEDGPLPLAELAAPAAACAERWEELLRSDLDVERVREHGGRGGERFRLADWHGFVQAVHHGDDHRTQINTLLSRQGVEPPNLDGWAFGALAEGEGEISEGAERLLAHFVGHHVWATDQTFRWYIGLSDEARGLTAGGTYGPIGDTLAHTVMSDHSYLARLRAHDWLDLGADLDFERPLPRRGALVPAWVIVLQGIHHGNDHRTHVGTVALAHGLEGPAVDAWSYAEAIGAYSEV